MKSKTKKISFGSGCAINDNMLYVASFIDSLEDINHTRMFVLNLDLPVIWHYHDLNSKTVISTAFRPQQNELARAGCALTTDGYIEIFNTKETSTTKISRNTYAPLTSLAVIDGIFFCCGTEGQIYKIESNRTEEIGQGIATNVKVALDKIFDIKKTEDPEKIQRLTSASRSITTLQSIDGLSKEDIYTCGTNGVIYHWNGKEWSKCRSGTRQHLHSIHCITQDDIMVCGHNGTIVRGNSREGFKRLASEKISKNFWCIRYFNDSIYIGTTNGLLVLKNGVFVHPLPPDLPLPKDYSIESLSSTEDTLWVVTNRFVLRLNQDEWQLIDHPDNL